MAGNGKQKIENPSSETLKVYGRARWLRLDVPKPFEPGATPRWEATAILDPSDVRGQAGIQLLLSTAARMSKETYGVVPLAIKKLAAKFLPGTKKVDLNDPANEDDGIQVPFSDGDAVKWQTYSGYAGMLIVSAHNSRLKPAVANRKGLTVQVGEAEYPYDGCYALFALTVWIHATHGAYDKRVGVNLRGVQYAAKGDPFTQDTIDAEDEFQALGDEEPVAASASDFD
jgi:Protein of unknown function (DUF2815)